MNTEIKSKPLNIFGLRRVKFCPPYFESVTVSLTYNLTTALENWIEEHTSGRYFIGAGLSLNKDNNTTIRMLNRNQIKIAFENNKDMCYFLLACPHLKY